MASISLNSLHVPVHGTRPHHGVAPGTHARRHEPGIEPLPAAIRPKAVQELFRRWPKVPSRELERIRHALLQCLHRGHPGREHQLSEPARELLDLVTAELDRRREAVRAGTEHTTA
ncbi:hypothetical protein ARTHRO9AX_190046 [Arthrobacter sp. 9AX]|uniref:hypothetical protein n=1 Tax=Arthrobacter sp. 9AX TaxID=2653131 RepID=UPI0012F1FEA5|nr:hypothetical protein [Arthrobacter sp. 9AX]VXB75442.1 hypothetical protein ARTHRO9AX_190046 [Arthrobacter sp. 9AX]